MKSFKNIVVVFTILSVLVGCNDEFMERFPKASINEANFWNSENELELYVNALYPNSNALLGHNTFFGQSQLLFGDNQSDNLVPLDYNTILAGEHIVPPSGGGWNWSFIRSCNYFLNRYDQTPINLSVKNRFAAEIKLLKALEYFHMVKRFGDVPWLSEDLNVNSPELFAPRDSRNLVMDSVLNDLNWAILNLPEKSNALDGRLHRDAALAAKARICLHEGTFRKYHNLQGHEKFLQEAYNASNELIESDNYQIHATGNPVSDYSTLFNSLDLSSNPEIIMFRRYLVNLLGNMTVQRVTDNAMNSGGSKSLIETYLADDGLPIDFSPRYLGDQLIEDEMLQRDPRLTQTFVYPRTNMQSGFPGPAIPGTDFAASSLSAGICPTGYQILKYFVDDQEEYLRIQQGILDAPLFRFGEILLIHAESAAELDLCDQNTLDKTINILRQRAGMPNMVKSEVESWSVNVDYRINYDNINSPLLNEIRRERRVELAVENFRYDDLMRWKEGKLLERTVKGMRFNPEIYSNLEIGVDIHLDEDGFILPYAVGLPNGRTFDENRHYFFPLPIDEMALNSNLNQNPGW
ncbi:MAG TPA: RagB/SusD family nutrient uptake outer membrane protein [Lunatimonas sp.]|nr:RagB/SusD family nutrient uptake outer membrane protein [Lunatimonas sp.]